MREIIKSTTRETEKREHLQWVSKLEKLEIWYRLPTKKERIGHLFPILLQFRSSETQPSDGWKGGAWWRLKPFKTNIEKAINVPRGTDANSGKMKNNLL